MRFLYTLCAFFLFCLVAVPSALAQEDGAVQVEEGAEVPQAQPSHQIFYYPVTRATLSQLYWKMGAYEFTNDTDIDNFMLLNKCDIYTQFYRDDFEWHKVRVKAKASLEKNVESFPTRFKMVQPIYLERYNIAQEQFPLAYPIHTSRFELQALDMKDWDCQNVAPSSRVWKYPSEAIVTFSTPLDIETLSVPSDIAKLYNEMYAHVGFYSNRPAYIVIKFKVFEADPAPNKRGLISGRANISAVVEKVEFYADADLTLHLSTLDFRRRNKNRMTGESLDNK